MPKEVVKPEIKKVKGPKSGRVLRGPADNPLMSFKDLPELADVFDQILKTGEVVVIEPNDKP